jgi:acetoin utilization protein AcuB
MLVQDVMRAAVLSVAPSTPLREVARLMRERGIRHLTVVEEGRLVGIVSDRDLKRAMAWSPPGRTPPETADALDRVEAREIMTGAVITTAPMFPVEEAARVMVREKISALPVTEGDRLVGIVTETDLLELLVAGLGVAEPSSRLDVALGERRSALGEVLRAVEEAGTPLSSVMTLTTARGFREAVLRLATIDPTPAVRALETKGFSVRDARRR